MAVYKRTYQGYSGPYTPDWSRFLVVSRYASRNLERSRVLTWFFIAALFPFLVTAVLIYISHNTALLDLLKLRPGTRLLSADASFFRNFLAVQMTLCFLLTAFAGPGLVSPDLTNNALVLYLCRPFSRAEYVLGKMAVLARVLSFLTWIPGLLLFLMEAGLSGWHWFVANLYIAGAIFLSSCNLILALSLLALAISAWVKWKPVAGALLLAVIFLGAGFGVAVNHVMRTELGSLFSIGVILQTAMDSLFGLPPKVEMPPTLAWAGLAGFAGACLFLLTRRLRAFEVVR